MITNRRSAAFTSKKPGKTQQFNYFDVNAPGDDARRPRFASANDGTAPAPRPRKRPWAPPGRFFLVDVPGSGYALAPGAARDAWAALLERYLAERGRAAPRGPRGRDVARPRGDAPIVVASAVSSGARRRWRVLRPAVLRDD
ncbi:GTP binding protein [Aureococcus anophagefferens]|nr:GTP binding protein [Aureococcus anophagefferens]